MITLKQTINYAVLISFTHLSIQTVSASIEPKSNQVISTQQQETLVKHTYKLKKFTQSCCAIMIEYSLKEVDGFIKQESNIENQELTVWFDPEKCTEEQIKEAINKTSYRIIES